jgi:hypothetical protein
MRGWDHEKQSYKVARGYRLATPEGTLVVVLEAESAEGETEGQSRRWWVNYSLSGVESTTLTPLGKGVQKLREQGHHFLDGTWLPDLRAEKDPDLRVKRIEALDKSNWQYLVADLPERMANGKNARRERLKTKFHAGVGGPPEPMVSFAFSIDPRTWPTWNHDADGRLWFRHPFVASIPEPMLPPAQADGWVLLRSTEPVPTEKMASPAPLMWKVESIVIDRIKLK